MHHDASSEAWGEEEAADAATAVTCVQKAVAAWQHSQALSSAAQHVNLQC